MAVIIRVKPAEQRQPPSGWGGGHGTGHPVGHPPSSLTFLVLALSGNSVYWRWAQGWQGGLIAILDPCLLVVGAPGGWPVATSFLGGVTAWKGLCVALDQQGTPFALYGTTILQEALSSLSLPVSICEMGTVTSFSRPCG